MHITIIGTGCVGLVTPKQSDVLILLTEWLQFREPDFTLIKQSLTKPLIFDGRTRYNPERMKRLGIEYISVGRNLNKRIKYE